MVLAMYKLELLYRGENGCIDFPLTIAHRLNTAAYLA